MKIFSMSNVKRYRRVKDEEMEFIRAEIAKGASVADVHKMLPHISYGTIDDNVRRHEMMLDFDNYVPSPINESRSSIVENLYAMEGLVL